MKIENAAGFNLSTPLMRDVQAAPQEETVDSVVADVLAGHKVRENLMEGSFVDRDSTPSRYIEGTMIGLKVETQFKNKMNAIVESYKLQAEAADSYAERALIGKKAAAAMTDTVEGEVSEAEGERMEKEREEDEERVEEKIEEKIEEKVRERDSEEDGAEEMIEAAAETVATEEGEIPASSAEQSTKSMETVRESVESTPEGAVPQESVDLTV
jgi:glutaredoxin-related protein